MAARPLIRQRPRVRPQRQHRPGDLLRLLVVKRPARQPQARPKARTRREGLTATQAEAELRRLIREVAPRGASADRLDVGEVGRRYCAHLTAPGRKRSTLTAVEMALRVWIEPHLGGRAFASVRPEEVENMMRAMTAEGVGPKSIRNYIGTLSAMYRYAMHPRRQWASTNPLRDDRPAGPPHVDGDSPPDDAAGRSARQFRRVRRLSAA